MKHGFLLTRLAPAVIGLGVVGAAYASGENASAPEPLRCEIKASENGSMILLDSVVFTDTAISGSYRLQIVSAGGSGSTNIRQGGGFSANAGDEVTLGRVMVGGYGAIYDASLQVLLNGQTLECSQRIGGNI